MEQNILQPVLNAFTRDETPANKYLGFIQEPLQVNIQGSSKKFLNRSTNIVLQIDHFLNSLPFPVTGNKKQSFLL